MKIFWAVSKLWIGHDFYQKNFKRGIIPYVGGVSVLVLCTSSDDGLYLYQVSGKYLERYQSYV